MSHLSRQEWPSQWSHWRDIQKPHSWGQLGTWHPLSWQPVPCGAACPWRHVWANTYSCVWNLSEASKEAEHGLSPMLRPRWSPQAEHKARRINVSKEKFEAQHWKPAKLSEQPPSLMEAANPGTRWGGHGAKRQHDRVTPHRVLLPRSCPEPGSLSRVRGGNEHLGRGEKMDLSREGLAEGMCSCQ